ncbi:MAG: hypothetical protein R2856_08895 [Caldilineaceae bacterium]
MQATFNIALNDLRVFFAERGNLIGLIVLAGLHNGAGLGFRRRR